MYLTKRGWDPGCPVHWLLADGFDVTAERARSLGLAVQSVLDAALADPLGIYPVPFDMGKLAEIGTLCECGAFRIRDAAGREVSR